MFKNGIIYMSFEPLVFTAKYLIHDIPLIFQLAILILYYFDLFFII